MTELNRVRALIQVRQPRISDFIRPYDKLNHGVINFTELLRAFEQANIEFNSQEIEYLQKNYVQDGQIRYQEILKSLTPNENPLLASSMGSHAGVTATYSEGLTDKYDDETERIIKFLQDGTRKRPVIGKQFFEDYDKLNDGIIVANEFARGLSLMYWALFRRYPTQTEIDKLIYRFWIDRLTYNWQKDFEFEAQLNEQREVDYESFLKLVGAAGPCEGDLQPTVRQPRLRDPGFAKYADRVSISTPEDAFQKIRIAEQKFRFDFKAFLQQKDKRNTGCLPLGVFVEACVDSISDYKRCGVEYDDFIQAAQLFVDEDAVARENYTEIEQEELRKNPLNKDLQVVNYRMFLKQLLSLGDVFKLADGSQRIEQLDTLNKCKKDAQQLVPLQKLKKYLQEHPSDLRQQFERFDTRNTGKVTGQQFKQVLGTYVQIYSKPVNPDGEEDNRTSARFVRQSLGLDYEELQELCNFYSIETISGIGGLNEETVSPDKLIGSGFYVDYITFVKDCQIENDYVPNNQERERNELQQAIIIPSFESVINKIANSLGTRHLKLADCLNQGQMQSTEWNRTIYGKLNCRKLGSALSNMLEIELSDAELCAIAIECADGLSILRFLSEKMQRDNNLYVLDLQVTPQLLEEWLDMSEISVIEFEEKLKPVTDSWRPQRVTGISQKQENEMSQCQEEVSVKSEREGMDVTAESVKHLTDLTYSKDFEDLVMDEVLKIEGQPYLIKDLYSYVKQPEEEQSLVEKAAAMILSVYLELHTRAAEMAPEFREFDKLLLGVVTPDEFARAFVLANMGGLITKFPCSFKHFTTLYEVKGGKFNNMVDYALMLRELGVPPPNSVFVSMEDQERKVAGYQKPEDYKSEEAEELENMRESERLASLEGVNETLAKYFLRYRPKLRNYFEDFDKGRHGICENSKLGTCLSQFNVLISKEELDTLSSHYECKEFGFEDCFEWRRFVENMEKYVGFRL